MLFPAEHQCGLSFLALNREHSDSMNGGGGGGGGGDRKIILISTKSVPVGAQQISPTRVNCLAGRIKLSLKSARIKNSPSHQAQNPVCCSPS